ncbi:mannose-1-phosphate guanylyltransferase [Chloroflexota bacterium]
MNNHLFAVIMAGGVGSRLWPRSRIATPKQFLDLMGPRTMLQETVDRIEPLIPLTRTLVVVNEVHAPEVRRQLPGLPEENILVEPGPRGTAPCIGLAAVVTRLLDPGATMAVFPADHRVADAPGFRQAIATAAQVAQDNYLVTLGIAPDRPHTGYGYIRRGAPMQQTAGLPAFRVRCFMEKPDATEAQAFVDSGEYYWNGGIFVWRTEAILSEMHSLLPQLHDELQAVAEAWNSPEFKDVIRDAWERVPRTTIDYGIMEKAMRVAVVPMNVGWDDVGNWSTLSQLVATDENGNVIRGQGTPLLLDTEDTYLYTSDGRLVAAIGLQGFVIVDTPDALLVCPKDKAQAVREVVERIKVDGLTGFL